MDIQKQIEEVETKDHEFYISVGSHQPVIASVLKKYLDGVLSENVRVESWGVHTKNEYIGIIDEQQSIISQQRQEIERVIAELEHEHKRQWDMERREPSRERQWYRQGGQDGLHFAINMLKEVLTNATNDGSGVSKADEATQVQSEENNG